jgi:hypothetical protein
MNRHVHYTLTCQWAKEEGFSEKDAQVIAQSNVLVDQHSRWRGLRNVKWHTSPKFAHKLLESACRERNLEKLGQSLHVAQDYCAHRHGLGRILGITYLNPKRHFDVWDDPAAPPEIKIDVEFETRRFLRAYQEAQCIKETDSAITGNEDTDAEAVKNEATEDELANGEVANTEVPDEMIVVDAVNTEVTTEVLDADDETRDETRDDS